MHIIHMKHRHGVNIKSKTLEKACSRHKPHKLVDCNQRLQGCRNMAPRQLFNRLI